MVDMTSETVWISPLKAAEPLCFTSASAIDIS